MQMECYCRIHRYYRFYLVDLVAKCKFDLEKAWKLVAVGITVIFKAAQPLYQLKVIMLEASTKLPQKTVFSVYVGYFPDSWGYSVFISVHFQGRPFIATGISL